jgi:hypothetical protein
MTNPKDESLTFDKFAIREKLALTLAKDASGSYVSYSTILADKAWKESRRAFAEEMVAALEYLRPRPDLKDQDIYSFASGSKAAIDFCIAIIQKKGGLE